MKQPLVTVVLPIYNVEKYLDRCIESVVNQTYNNLEILMIDDGSPDRCPQMCEEWAKKDPRIRVILASDFGIRWEQSNWKSNWYWAEKVDSLTARGMDHAQLLGCAAPKPFCLLAGEFDNMDSWEMMCRAPGYAPGDGRLKIVNHATGHRPTKEALEAGYDFLDRWLK